MARMIRLVAVTFGLLVVLLPLMATVPSSTARATAAGTWSLTGSLHIARFGHTATLLSNGQVLVAGGDDGAGDCCLASSPGAFSQKTSLESTPKTGYYASINDSKIPDSPCFCPHSVASAELYNPTTATW